MKASNKKNVSPDIESDLTTSYATEKVTYKRMSANGWRQFKEESLNKFRKF